MSPKTRHPIGFVTLGFSQAFASNFQTPRASDIAAMKAQIFTFVDALTNAVIASFGDELVYCLHIFSVFIIMCF